MRFKSTYEYKNEKEVEYLNLQEAVCWVRVLKERGFEKFQENEMVSIYTSPYGQKVTVELLKD